MRLSKIRKLVKLLEESNMGELEVSSWGQRVRIRKKIPDYPNDNILNQYNYSQPKTSLSAQQSPSLNSSSKLETIVENRRDEEAHNLIEIKSPMVGTFYRAPTPESKPYIEVGKFVKEKQIICMIEAMKLINEIESKYEGRIVEALVENGKSIEWGQPLFLLEPSTNGLQNYKK